MALAKRCLPLLRIKLRKFSVSSIVLPSLDGKRHDEEHHSHQQTLDYLEKTDSQVSLDYYTSLLHRYMNSRSLSDGKHLHSQILARNTQHHKILRRLLIQMYAKCDPVDHAFELLEGMQHEDATSWNIMIKEYIKNGRRKDAISFYTKMCEAEIDPDQITFTTMLSAYQQPDDLYGGRVLHNVIVENGFDSDAIVSTALVSMYGKCGDLESALSAAEVIKMRDLVSWNALIVVLCGQGKGNDALRLFWQMLHEGMNPNRVTLVNILGACTSKHLHVEAKKLHTYIISTKSESDTVLGTALIKMYGKCGNAIDGRHVFNNIVSQDLVSWSALITAYVQHSLHKEALQLFERMKQESFLPDKITSIHTLNACAEHQNVSKGKQVHADVLVQGFDSDTVVGTTLIYVYSKCGSTDYALKVFSDMQHQDMAAWNVMLTTEAHNKNMKHTSKLFERMQLEGVMPCKNSFFSAVSAISRKEILSHGKRFHVCIIANKLYADILLGNTLISMYGKCDEFTRAERVFDDLFERNLVSWNVMISACGLYDSKQKAWQFFEQMRVEGFLPDKVTFVIILDACITQTALTKGKIVHSCILAARFEYVFLGSALVNMYGKCGSLEDAEKALNHMPMHNVISWNALLATFAQHGKVKRCIQCFRRMKEELKPNETTFTIILSACSHAGLIEEACDFFSCMTMEYGIKPSTDHYACMIDLLGRAGRLDEAENILNRTPCEKTTVLYKTLLGACIHQNDVERGKKAAKVAIEMNKDDATPFVSLLNIFGSASQTSAENLSC